MNRVKNLEKDLGLYTITVNNKLIDKLRFNYSVDEKFGRFILTNGCDAYTKYMGFNPEYTRLEEIDNGLRQRPPKRNPNPLLRHLQKRSVALQPKNSR